MALHLAEPILFIGCSIVSFSALFFWLLEESILKGDNYLPEQTPESRERCIESYTTHIFLSLSLPPDVFLRTPKYSFELIG